MTGLDPALRAMLVCPSCRGELTDVKGGLLCEKEEALYPIVDGVPHLLPELARRPTPEERAAP